MTDSQPPPAIATFLDKGGVGKTTSTVHLAVALAEEGLTPLVIDLAGKQQDVAKQFGLFEEIRAADPWPHIGSVFSEDWRDIVEKVGIETALDEMVWETDEGVDIIPAHKSLDALDDDLASVPVEQRYQRLHSFLTEDVPESYSVVLVDLPGLTNNISMNGLFATRRVLAPVELGRMELTQLEELERDLDQLHETFGVDIELTMVLANRVDARTALGREKLADLEADYAESVAPAAIPASQDIRNALEDGMTVFGLEEPSATAERAREAYRENARALIDRLNIR
jgi:chromosome partitioning protein